MKKEESEQRLSQKNNIMIVFLWISFNLILVSGSSDGKEVIQKPERIFSNQGQSVGLTCRHEIDNYDRILWYKQVENKEMQFLGYMYSVGYPEDEKKMDITGGARKSQNCTLTILKVDLNSSAVYFCAASLHSRSSYSDNITQTPGDIFTKTGNPAKMTCRHTVSSFNRILWYKQLKRKEMQFLGNMVGGSAKPEDETVKIEGNANANKNCTLTILAVDLNSSAVYFCAASIHNASYLCFSIQKPSDVVFSSSLCHSSPHLYQSAVTVFFSSP
ncbi:uncharacterized protein LOC127142195 [Xyrichtys novacula]|uniref:Uncharacterized protein LOC127142195 n=1 Tax=Xyrichtys novacula TaxID=13765 RepID=A0AAV1GL94_XYRNO|nr:uncharacterized protein LOC127142195 [Xyrichtys novacula]